MELRTSFIYWKVLSCLNVILVYNTIMHKPASFVGYYIGITPQTKSGVRCPFLVIMFIGINIMHNISSRAFAVQFDSKKRQVSTKTPNATPQDLTPFISFDQAYAPKEKLENKYVGDAVAMKTVWFLHFQKRTGGEQQCILAVT